MLDLALRWNRIPLSDNGNKTFKIKRGKTISHDNNARNKKNVLIFIL